VEVVQTHADGTKRPAVDAVVWLPGAEVPESARPAAPTRIAQRHKTFEPHVEVVSVGSSVDFPNFDRFYHNVFSLSEIAHFDLGLYRNGASRAVKFTKPGVIRIYCNIHPTMSAFLVVVEGNAFAKTGADGTALLPPVTPGAYRLSVWHERGGEQTLNVVVKPGSVTPIEVSLDASRWRSQPHKNKYGKDYLPPDDDQTRY
jgi:plastocyanin